MKQTGIYTALVLSLALAVGFIISTSALVYDKGQWLPPHHPEQQKLDRLAESFSAGEVLVIGFALEGGFFAPAPIAALDRLEKQLQAKLGSHLLDSLSPLSAQHILDTGESLEIASFGDLLNRGLIKTHEDYQRIFMEGPYGGRLVAKEGRAAALRLRLDSKDQPDRRQKALALIEDELQAHPIAATARLTGEPIIKERLRAESEQGLPRLLLWASVLLAVMAVVFVRRPANVAAGLGSAFLSASASLALMAWRGHDINAIALMLPVMLAIIAFADALHIAAHIRREGDLLRGLKRAALPCFAASLTSAIGFGAFAFSELLPLQHFGLTAMLAILAAFPLTMLVCYGVLGLAAPETPVQSSGNRAQFLATATAFLAGRYPRLVGGGLAALLLVLACGLLTARTETNFLSVFFYPESQIRQDFAFIDKNLGGSGGIDVILHAANPAEKFNTMSGFLAHQAERETLATLPYGRGVESYELALGEAGRAFSGTRRQPQNEAELGQLLLFLELSRSETGNDVLSPYASFLYDETRLYLRLPDLSSRQLAHLIASIEKKPPPKGIARRELTGFGTFIHVLSEEVLHTQLFSFALTAFLIALLFLLQFGWLQGALGLAANFLPITALGGVIALTNTPFDFGTVLIAGITLGMSVDDAVHFLYAWRRHRHLPAEQALFQVLALTGRPILLTSLVFCTGLAALFASPLAVLDRFAFFTMTGLVFSVLACLVLLPAFLMSTARKD